MSAPVLGAALLVAFVLLHVAGERLPRGWTALPLTFFGLALAAGGIEGARWDHGHPDWMLGIGYVGAPIAFILGASLAGARWFYGWPDLGPMPGRLAAVAAALLLGVFGGSRWKEADVRTTMARGDDVARGLRAWHDAHAGAWPASFEQAAIRVPETAMGGFDHPVFRYDPRVPRLSFPLRTGSSMTLDLADAKAVWKEP